MSEMYHEAADQEHLRKELSYRKPLLDERKEWACLTWAMAYDCRMPVKPLPSTYNFAAEAHYSREIEELYTQLTFYWKNKFPMLPEWELCSHCQRPVHVEAEVCTHCGTAHISAWDFKDLHPEEFNEPAPVRPAPVVYPVYTYHLPSKK
jgi:CRISPR/Cas system-associated protein Cas10 (large subunit of type III CRISPR-Cas system)